jgi:hypothetical protein
MELTVTIAVKRQPARVQLVSYMDGREEKYESCSINKFP